jgi:hypothetical protein
MPENLPLFTRLFSCRKSLEEFSLWVFGRCHVREEFSITVSIGVLPLSSPAGDAQIRDARLDGGKVGLGSEGGGGEPSQALLAQAFH